MNHLGIVAIGRNEGERLRRCLTSVTGDGLPVVYVDSGSTDGSLELARQMGAVVVELDMSRPFTAAAAAMPASRSWRRSTPISATSNSSTVTAKLPPAGSNEPPPSSRADPTLPLCAAGAGSGSPSGPSTTTWPTWNGTHQSEKPKPAAAMPYSGQPPSGKSTDSTLRSSPAKRANCAFGYAEKAGSSSESTPR